MSAHPISTMRSPQRLPLSVSYVPLDLLKRDPRNARQHSAKQIRQIAKSIETFGFNVPFLIDADRNVIAGHGRLLAAKQLGWTEVLDHSPRSSLRARKAGLYDR